MRFLHSADWQLGQLPKQVRCGLALRQQRFETAREIVRLAKQHSVDCVLLCGDTFDSPDLDERQLRAGIEILEELAPTPVLMLPGNHDPWQPGGIWQRRAWREVGAHVHVLSQSEELTLELEGLEQVAFYPCPLSQKKSRLDPTDWIPVREQADTRLRIGLAHGSLTTLSVQSSFPIDKDRATTAGLDYLALGDWHGMQILERTAYPGTPEATGFGELGVGHVLLVELDPSRPPEQRRPRVEPIEVAHHWWRSEERTLRDPTDLSQLRADLLQAERLDAGLVRLVVHVAAHAEIGSGEIEELRQQLDASLFELDWRLTIGCEEGITLPPGVLSEVDAALASLAEGLDPGTVELPLTKDQVELLQASEQLPEIAAAARRLLRQLAEART